MNLPKNVSIGSGGGWLAGLLLVLGSMYLLQQWETTRSILAGQIPRSKEG
jgi:hypothetical protein